MALLDFLKNKKEADNAKEIKKKEIKKIDKAIKASATTEKPVQKSSKGKKTADFSYDIIKEPHISEKGTMLSDSNRYVFKVYENANAVIWKFNEGF